MVPPRVTAPSTRRRDPSTPSGAAAAIAPGPPWRATATTSAIVRECPSSVTGTGMREEATWNSTETPRQTPASRRLPRPCHLLPGERRAPGRRQLQVPRIRLHAEIEDQILPAHVRHTQPGVALHQAFDDLAHVPEAGLRQEGGARVAARRSSVA